MDERSKPHFSSMVTAVRPCVILTDISDRKTRFLGYTLAVTVIRVHKKPKNTIFWAKIQPNGHP
jgi:hypothetical protein